MDLIQGRSKDWARVLLEKVTRHKALLLKLRKAKGHGRSALVTALVHSGLIPAKQPN